MCAKIAGKNLRGLRAADTMGSSFATSSTDRLVAMQVFVSLGDAQMLLRAMSSEKMAR